MKKKIIVVAGATASGKSKVALELAKKFNGFLISADSRQIYQGMDIGTNKDDLNFRDGKYFVDGVEETLVNVVEPDENFSLDDWVRAVVAVLNGGTGKRGDRDTGALLNDVPVAPSPGSPVPIIVGGTGLYISALTENYDLQGGFDESLREKYETMIKEKGINAVIDEIKKIDPDIEGKIDTKNPRRVARAAEICFATGKPFSREKRENPNYEFLLIGMDVAREELYKKINSRVDQMIENGLIDEVKGLMAKGYSCDLPSMTGIGYRQICQYLNGESTREKTIELIKRDTRRYAKRQMTWFRRNKKINWIKNIEEAESLAEKFIAEK